MQLTVHGVDLPGRTWCDYTDIRVGVQRGKVAEELVAADAAEVTWQLELSAKGGDDVRGPHVQGRPGARFAYLVWEGSGPAGATGMFRRIKVPLDPTAEPLRSALAADTEATVQIGLTAGDGSPRCGGLKAHHLTWVASGPAAAGKTR